MIRPQGLIPMSICFFALLASENIYAGDLKHYLIAAIDSPDGRSDGELSGSMADLFKGQTHSSAPVKVQVRTLSKFSEDGCARLEANLIQDNVPTKDGKQIPVVIRYELNLCRDGHPPKEAIDLNATSRVLSSEPPEKKMRE